MKTTLTMFVVLLLSTNVLSQDYIIFTSANNDNSEVHKFWKMNVDSPFVYNSISDKLDAIAPFPGQDGGSITVSKDGNWYAFLSTRFEQRAQGWEALTIVKSDFSEYDVIQDQSGNLIHSEDRAFVFSNGTAVVFVADFGNHTRDIFVMHKTANKWGDPINITENSYFAFNYYPYLSADGKSILFDASNSSWPSTAIGTVNIDGSNINFPITTSSIPNCVATHSPSYNYAGDLIFEADDGTERIWKLPAGSIKPVLLNSSANNDNSPISLSDNRIASLWFPGNWHQIKIMNADGSGYTMITDSSALFTEVFDTGLSTFSKTPSSVHDASNTDKITIYPNPVKNSTNIRVANFQKIETIQIFNTDGQIIMKIFNPVSDIIDFSTLANGIYLIRIDTKERHYAEKLIKY